MDALKAEIGTVIEELNKKDIDWQKLKENNYNAYKEIYDDLIIRLIELFRSALKITSPDECQKGLKEVLELAGWVPDVFQYASATMGYYSSFRSLREMDETSIETVCILIERAFDNYVLRTDKDFLESFSMYGVKNQKELMNILRSLDILTDFYVANSCSKDTIKNDFQNESGLSDKACYLYAELVNKNYMEIKLNLIYNKLAELEK